MVVRAVLYQGGKKGFKRVVWAFWGTNLVKIGTLGAVFTQKLFSPPKICDSFEEKRRLFGIGPAR